MDERWHNTAVPGLTERAVDGFAGDRDYTVAQKQYVEPIWQANHEGRMEGNGVSASKAFRRVASIPHLVYYQWIDEWVRAGKCLPNDDTAIAKLVMARLRDPDYALFRSSSGAI